MSPSATDNRYFLVSSASALNFKLEIRPQATRAWCRLLRIKWVRVIGVSSIRVALFAEGTQGSTGWGEEGKTLGAGELDARMGNRYLFSQPSLPASRRRWLGARSC